MSDSKTQSAAQGGIGIGVTSVTPKSPSVAVPVSNSHGVSQGHQRGKDGKS